MPKNRKPSTPSPKPEPAAKRKRGRPEYEPTTQHRELAVVMSAMGIPHEQMVLAFINPMTGKPISPVTLRKVFREELEKGEVQANTKVAAALFKNATTATEQFPGGNPTAQIFWMKTRARWQQRPELQPPPRTAESDEVAEVETQQDALRRAAFVIAAELTVAAELPEPKPAKGR